MSFIKDYIEAEKIKRRDFLMRSAAGMGTLAMATGLGTTLARALIYWAYYIEEFCLQA